MTTTNGTINVFVERYAYPRVSTMTETPARIVGALAVHRPVYWGEGDFPEQSNRGRKPEGWTVTHIASGKSVASVHFDRCIGYKRADLIQWVEAWQEACPEWFAALAAVPTWSAGNELILQVDKDLTRAAVDKGRELSRMSI